MISGNNLDTENYSSKRLIFLTHKMFTGFITLFTLTNLVFATAEYIPPMKGMQLLLITCDTQEKLDFVLKFKKDVDFDFLKILRFSSDNVEVVITHSKVAYFKKQLESHDIKYKVYVEDVEEMEKNVDKISRRRRRRSLINFIFPYSFDYFPRHYVINNYLRRMAETYDDISLIDIGSSFESRKMYGVKISNNKSNNTKPAILIDAGAHAREWISITTALFAIKELVKESNKHLYENVDWYIFPLINPDGYEFSHSEYRLWRKTRSNTFNYNCKGVDINRNFGYKWMDTTEATDNRSEDPCENVYAGDRAFSEVETQNLRDFVLSKNGTIKLYSALHCTSGNRTLIVLPWGFTSKYPPNYQSLSDLAKKSAAAISPLYGTNYTIGVASYFYDTSPGSSIDWFIGVANTSISYTLELPGISFITPEDKIENIGREIFEAFKVFGKYVKDNYV